MEIIAFIATVIGGIAGIYAIIDYRKKNVHQPKDEREHLIMQFKMNQKLSKKLIIELQEYAGARNVWEEDFMPMLSFRVIVAGLEDSQRTNLSDELLKGLYDLPLTAPNIQSMVRSLETQFNAMLEMDARLRTLRMT